MPHGPVKISEDYEARYDAEALLRAEEIKSDPARMERVQKHVSLMKQNLKRLSGSADSDSSMAARGYRKLG